MAHLVIIKKFNTVVSVHDDKKKGLGLWFMAINLNNIIKNQD